MVFHGQLKAAGRSFSTSSPASSYKGPQNKEPVCCIQEMGWMDASYSTRYTCPSERPPSYSDSPTAHQDPMPFPIYSKSQRQRQWALLCPVVTPSSKLDWTSRHSARCFKEGHKLERASLAADIGPF